MLFKIITEALNQSPLVAGLDHIKSDYLNQFQCQKRLLITVCNIKHLQSLKRAQGIHFILPSTREGIGDRGIGAKSVLSLFTFS